MRRNNRMQRILYMIMIILGVYIFYKSADILTKNKMLQKVIEKNKLQSTLEDFAVLTHLPGLAAAAEDKKENLTAFWMQQSVPVFSYLKELETEVKTETEQIETEQIETEIMIENIIETDIDPAIETAVQNSDGIMEKLEDYNYLICNYFTVDPGTTADMQLLDAEQLMEEDLYMERNPSVPQILIYHTHSQEAFVDSREGVVEDSIIGIGEVLADELRTRYGYQVIHDTSVYDLVDGILDRSAAYDYARAGVVEILEKYPSIEVLIDLHRDGVEGQKFVTEIEGRPTARIMFFNGISRDSQNQPIPWLENPYISQNLAFSLQLEVKAKEQYPDFTRNNYLKAERFNLHLRPRSLLIEAGTQMNTVEEEKNAMLPLADLLHQVLCGEDPSGYE